MSMQSGPRCLRGAAIPERAPTSCNHSFPFLLDFCDIVVMHRSLPPMWLGLHYSDSILKYIGIFAGGAEGDRTPDLVNAIHALSQLSYGPMAVGKPGVRAGPA